MTTINTADLIDAPLDWAVAKCLYSDEYDRTRVFIHQNPGGRAYTRITNQPGQEHVRHYSFEWMPSTNWAQGGPITGRENISFTDQHGFQGKPRWLAALYTVEDSARVMAWGPTQLIAAMRCYVASKLGDTVDVPEELL